MRRWLRPSLLVIVSAALLLAAIVILWPVWGQTRIAAAVPLPVPAGDQEIVFLAAATTNAASWERFVAAVHRLPTDRPELGVRVVADLNAFPEQTTTVPEIAIAVAGRPGRLWFRWYKLTGDAGTNEWADALMRRQPPPLAIIGGSSSDRARDVALEMDRQRSRLADPPLLLITTATAESVSLDNNHTAKLMELYPGRTLRYCFTDRQIAEAVTDFTWRHATLRPDRPPVYLAHWQDDPYSEDLFDRFREVLCGEEGNGGVLRRSQTMTEAARRWVWLASPLSLASVQAASPQTEEDTGAELVSAALPFSIGDYNQPSLYDTGAAQHIMAMRERYHEQRRPLLVLPAAPQPARRLLHALLRIDPLAASRFIVLTGDGIDFNTIYRDRKLAWPIQDLPFTLILFCHRNPVDPIAFQPDDPSRAPAIPNPGGQTSTGTQDLLLYRDIVETLARAAYGPRGLTSSPGQLQQVLRALPEPRFDTEGDLQSGSGEYVVVLRPSIRPGEEGEQINPQARLQVWNRRANHDGRKWVHVPVAGKPEMIIPYSLSPGGDEEEPGP